MKSLLCVLLCLPITLIAQDSTSRTGIKWTTNLSWQQVKTKAKQQKKYIFLDCYATWCKPCKQMDKDVYPQPNVGGLLNKYFISVKVQIDSTKQDNEEITKWHKDANAFVKNYDISGFPTFLFFSPNGKLVHKGIGAVADSDFIKLASNALNPNRQYYTLLTKYKKGSKDYSQMRYLASICQELGNDKLAREIAADYLKNYLFKEKNIESFTKKDIEFIRASIQNSKDLGFNFFYQNGAAIDSKMGPGFADQVLYYIISVEEIDPFIYASTKDSTTPNWEKIFNTIQSKYSSKFANYTVLNAKIRWYEFKNSWPEAIECYLVKEAMYGLDTANGFGGLNNMAWNIFVHSDNKNHLKKGIGWMQIVLNAVENDGRDNSDDEVIDVYLDTYANLLYKVGRKDEAIEWEQKAYDKLATQDSRKKTLRTYKETIEKMKRGEPTGRTW